MFTLQFLTILTSGIPKQVRQSDAWGDTAGSADDCCPSHSTATHPVHSYIWNKFLLLLGVI